MKTSAGRAARRGVALLVLRRVAWGAALLVVVSLATFLLAEAAPGDYFSALRLDPRLSTETVARWSERHGTDRPLPIRYGRWIASVAAGDLGWSLAHQAPVAPLLARRAGHTLWLTVIATLLAWLVALPWGIWAAARPHGLLDRAAGVVSSLLLAVPELLIALAFLLWAVHRGLPVLAGAGWRQLPIPAAALAALLFPVLLRHVRAAVAAALGDPWVEIARAHGVGGARLLRLALHAASPPLLTLLGLSLGGLLSGSFVVEVVLGWPGMGVLLYDAILARDLHVVVAAILLSATLLVVGNLLADLALVVVDPRLRGGEAT